MKESKIIVLTCVHGRMPTVEKAINLSPKVERVFVYSNDSDGEKLRELGFNNIFKHDNMPLSNKWNYGVEMLKDFDFDGAIIMGSDDYFDENFLDFVKDNIQDYEMIGFKDIYFEDVKGFEYYWGGYVTNRVGEPIGAGRVYSKEYLERIGYNLFPYPVTRGIDGQSWVIVNFTKAKRLVTTLKENNLYLCDIKDGQGITKLKNINGLVKVGRR